MDLIARGGNRNGKLCVSAAAPAAGRSKTHAAVWCGNRTARIVVMLTRSAWDCSVP
jgi:hypothetical protein